MNFSNDLKYKYGRLSIVEKLIVINIVVFIIDRLIPFLFQLDPYIIVEWFQLPKEINDFIWKPWTIVTYAFFHGSIGHIFWNMLLLFFVGRSFLNLFGGRRFLNVYFLGGIVGGLLFLISYNVFPVFLASNTPGLIGASAAVLAILIFLSTYMPNMEVRLIFFNVKLWYIGLALVLWDLVMISTGNNSGGRIAHLGGALLGYLYANQLSKGRDIGSGFEKMMSGMAGLFKPKKKSPLKTVHRNQNKSKSTYTGKKTTTKSTAAGKTEDQRKIDEILDKISKSGYESLSKSEKDFLFKAGKND